MNSVRSVKYHLKKRAIDENRTFQEILTTYALERTLYRLSISPYAKHYILKGGILLYGLFNGQYTRATSDIDFLGTNLNSDIANIKENFYKIFSIDFTSDFIYFDLESLKAIPITEFKKYPGTRVSILGYLEKTKINVNIDIGFGDTVFPATEVMQYPTLLNQDPPMLNVYSKESIIAEKIHAVITLGNANTRMKDFYDLYKLFNTYTFTSDIIIVALEETFANRKTSFEFLLAFEFDYKEDPLKFKNWSGFLKSKNVQFPLRFDEVIHGIELFIEPLRSQIQQKTRFSLKWNPNYMVWE